MSKRFIRKDVLEKVRTLSAFDYLRNYAPDLLVKNGRTDYYHRDHDSLHFPMENGIGGHKVKVEHLHLII